MPCTQSREIRIAPGKNPDDRGRVCFDNQVVLIRDSAPIFSDVFKRENDLYFAFETGARTEPNWRPPELTFTEPEKTHLSNNPTDL